MVIDETGTAKPIVGSKVSELVARDKNSKNKLAAIGGAYQFEASEVNGWLLHK